MEEDPGMWPTERLQRPTRSEITFLYVQQLCLYYLLTKDYWLHTLENAPDRQDCTRVTDYVTETWMNGRFSPPTWNHYQTEGSRTNNHLEGWHNKLKKRVKITHPSIYAILKEFKKEQTANEAKMLPYAACGKRRKTVKRYQEVDERLQRLKTQMTSEGVKIHPVWRFSILYFEAGLI